MPVFDTINNVYTPAKQLNHTEMLRAIKLGIASEYEAIQIYQQIMESTDNESVKIILTDITHDEMHHAGQLAKLLEILGPEDLPQYEHGVNQAIQQLGLNQSDAAPAPRTSQPPRPARVPNPNANGATHGTSPGVPKGGK